MRQLILRLARVGDCTSSSSSSASSTARRRQRGGRKAHAGTPEGHVPVYVVGGGDGEEEAAERFVVRAELLGAPALAELLGRAAQEYGYRHQGPLRVRCSVAVFRRALAAVAGEEEDDDEQVVDGE